MLNIGKLAHGQHRYYIEAVALGTEDYYLGSGEAPGYWLGGGAAILGLVGKVEEEPLRHVLSGEDPYTGGNLLMRRHKERVPGWDATFRAPKSVSLLHALGTDDTRLAVRDAHDQAVAAAVDFLERHASQVRRGYGGVDRIDSTGFVAAAFRHRTSRAGDPLLHTHVVMANMLEGADGNWSAINGTLLYTLAKTTGYLYQAELRHALTRELGVDWTEVRNGLADVAGVPRKVIKAFSKRREEIEGRMAIRGETSAKAAQTATLSTRHKKDYGLTPEALEVEWHERAERLGFGPEELAATLGRTVVADVTQLVDAMYEDMAGPAGLTEQASTFQRRDTLRAVCDRLPTGATVAQVEALADTFLGSDQVLTAVTPGVDRTETIQRADGSTIRTSVEQRFTTPEMVATEERVLAAAVERVGAGVGIVAAGALDPILERNRAGPKPLSAEQVHMVTELTTSGRGVEVVVGKAGAGKTLALATARAAWEAEGRHVYGCALAARAALELQTGAGITSFTLDSLLLDLESPESEGHLPPDAVVVVDEAGMLGTRKLDRLLTLAAAADAKVVLVGDHHQLPEVDAGGAFRGLHHRLPAIELTENRRQIHDWEREALVFLREGDAAPALSRYEEHGRLFSADNPIEVRERLVSDWWASYQAGDSCLMVAMRQYDVDQLNAQAHALRSVSGQLGVERIVVSDREYAGGDRVMALKNKRYLGLRNGTKATVLRVSTEDLTMRVRTDDGHEVEVPADYLRDNMTHGYALTGHKAQGVTTDKTFILGGEDLYREWGYTALSRGVSENRMYILTPEHPWADELDVPPAREIPDPLLMVVGALKRSRAQFMAIEGGATAGISGTDTLDLEKERDSLRQSLRSCPPDVDSELQIVRTELADAERSLAKARAKVPEGAKRRDPAKAAAALWETRVAELRQAEVGLVERAAAREAWAEENAVPIARYRAVTAELALRQGRTVTRLQLDPPPYVVRVLGEVPGRPGLRKVWTRGVYAIERYRARWGVDDATSALGPKPTSGIQRHDWETTHRNVDDLRRRLDIEQRAPTKVRRVRAQ